jgi:hypothetical protein
MISRALQEKEAIGGNGKARDRAHLQRIAECGAEAAGEFAVQIR